MTGVAGMAVVSPMVTTQVASVAQMLLSLGSAVRRGAHSASEGRARLAALFSCRHHWSASTLLPSRSMRCLWCWGWLVWCCPSSLAAQSLELSSSVGSASTELSSPFLPPPASSTQKAGGTVVGLLRHGTRRWHLLSTANGGLRRVALAPLSAGRKGFWDLELRDVALRPLLYQLAELRGMNLVLESELDGRVMLRLAAVPWEQAWGVLLEQHALEAHQDGQLLRVRRRTTGHQQDEEVLSLVLRFAVADDVAQLLRAAVKGGHVAADARTNMLFLRGDDAQRRQLRKLAVLADVPVRQVSIEARIAMVRADAVEQLGVRWRVAGVGRLGGSSVGLGADDESVQALLRGSLQGDLIGESAVGRAVDFGGAPAGLGIGVASNSAWLSLALAALESKGLGEVIARPRIITGDRQTATVRSGTQIPFQESADNGGTTVRFKDAVLGLEVTPAITADDHILLELVINQDAPGGAVEGGGGSLLSIDTTELRTSVLARSGETVVLGGILREEQLHSELRVPLLGSLPLLGPLFRRQTHSSLKTETLVFITPHILPGE